MRRCKGARDGLMRMIPGMQLAMHAQASRSCSSASLAFPPTEHWTSSARVPLALSVQCLITYAGRVLAHSSPSNHLQASSTRHTPPPPPQPPLHSPLHHPQPQLRPPCRASSAAPPFAPPRACARPRSPADGTPAVPACPTRGRLARRPSRPERSATLSSTYVSHLEIGPPQRNWAPRTLPWSRREERLGHAMQPTAAVALACTRALADIPFQVLLAIMSGIFGVAGWHFCKSSRAATMPLGCTL